MEQRSEPLPDELSLLLADKEPDKPKTYNGDLANLPEALKPLTEEPRWVCWEWQLRDGKDGKKKWTKPPLRPQRMLYFASHSDPKSWGTYKAAVQMFTLQPKKVDGIGYCLLDSKVCGIDIDHCRDPTTGAVTEAAQKIVDAAKSYTEISPSGTGLRIFGYGNDTMVDTRGNVDGADVEVYRVAKRYLTVTGNPLGGAALPLAKLDSIIDQLSARLPQGQKVVALNPQPVLDGTTIMTSLPIELQALIAKGMQGLETDTNTNSHQFYRVVGELRRHRFAPAAIYALLRKYPDGIAHRYIKGGRLWDQVNACYLKIESDEAAKRQNSQNAAEETLPDIVSSSAFVKGFQPPDYVIEGVLQQGFCYALTGPTNAGKTLITLLMSAHVALGRDIGGHEVKQGQVLYLAGENPTDVRMRWIALCENLNIDPEQVPIHFMDKTFKISATFEKLSQRIAELELSNLVMVVIDTNQAFYEGDNANDNVQQKRWGQVCRRLTTLPGAPLVIVNSHPVKHAKEKEEMIPSGGGSFLNEIDGNQTAIRDGELVEVHWTGKWRGSDFAPLTFKIVTPYFTERLTDGKGNKLSTALAQMADENDVVIKEAGEQNDDFDLLELISKEPSLSLSQYATRLGWNYTSKDKTLAPNKMLVKRKVEKLVKAKLVRGDSGNYKLTKDGREGLQSYQNRQLAASDDCPF
jgi:hypothetical protein